MIVNVVKVKLLTNLQRDTKEVATSSKLSIIAFQKRAIDLFLEYRKLALSSKL